MKFNRKLIPLVGLALFLTACDKDQDEAASLISKADSNPLLAYVPAETPYVAADLETIPKDISAAYMERFQPVLDASNEQLATFRKDYANGKYEDDAQATLASAILDELNGEVSEENFAKLGLSLQAHHVMYGMGMFPVMRMELTDADALRAAVERIETKMGVSMPQAELNGQAYWMLTDEDAKGAGIYIAILDNQLAMSIFPTNAEAELLPALLGQSMPAESIATGNVLGNMNRDKGYSNYGSGFADLQKIADQMLDSNSFTRTLLGTNTDFDTSSYDQVCITEFKSIVAKAPRITAGVTSLDKNQVATRYDLELQSHLANGLAALVSSTPEAEEGDHLLSAALAIRVGKLRSFMLEKAKDLMASPYQCEHLRHLNEGAHNLAAKMSFPMPPMINNLMGFRLKVNDLDPSMSLMSAGGLLAIYVDKPEMFVGMASMMLPGFAELDLPNQKQPVKIPASLTRLQGVDVYALMSKNAIGTVIGQQSPAELPAFLNAKPQDTDTLFSMSIDMAKQMQIEDALADQWKQYSFGMDAADATNDMDDWEDMDEAASPVSIFSDTLRDAYAAMLDRSRFNIKMNENGVAFENRMTFK